MKNESSLSILQKRKPKPRGEKKNSTVSGPGTYKMKIFVGWMGKWTNSWINGQMG